MNKLYTAVGKFRCRGRGDYRTPYIMLGEKEYLLDLQEMLLWSTLNWRILSMEEAFQLYNVKVLEVGCSFSRSPEDVCCRLLQRGLVAEGIGRKRRRCPLRTPGGIVHCSALNTSDTAACRFCQASSSLTGSPLKRPKMSSEGTSAMIRRKK